MKKSVFPPHMIERWGWLIVFMGALALAFLVGSVKAWIVAEQAAAEAEPAVEMSPAELP